MWDKYEVGYVDTEQAGWGHTAIGLLTDQFDWPAPLLHSCDLFQVHCWPSSCCAQVVGAQTAASREPPKLSVRTSTMTMGDRSEASYICHSYMSLTATDIQLVNDTALRLECTSIHKPSFPKSHDIVALWSLRLRWYRELIDEMKIWSLPNFPIW